MNSFMLISLRGIRETLQFLNGKKRLIEIERNSNGLVQLKLDMSKIEETQKAITNLVVAGSSYSVFFLLMLKLYNKEITLYETILPMIALISSFGPVIALSNLSIGLSETIACGRRVKNLLNEKPVVNEIKANKEITDENLSVNNIDSSIIETINSILKHNKSLLFITTLLNIYITAHTIIINITVHIN